MDEKLRLVELEKQVKEIQRKLNNITILLEEYFSSKPECPRCGSRNVSLGPRGTSGTRRFFLGSWADIGGMDMFYTCERCGERWKAEEVEQKTEKIEQDAAPQQKMIPSGVTLCKKCGYQVFHDEEKCSHCGKAVSFNDKRR